MIPGEEAQTMSIRARASVVIPLIAMAGALCVAPTLAAPTLAASPSAGGGAVPHEDFNGDMYDDLAIGIPGATVDGHAHAGAIEVLYGGPKGLHAAGSQLWSLASPGVPGLPSTDDQLGFSVASGDFNGDGYDDLVAGAPFADVRLTNGTTYADTGMLLVLFGSANGLTSSHAQWISDGTIQTGAHAGWALASCDMVGAGGKPDGRDDIAVGAPGTNDVNVVYGMGLHAGQRSAEGINTPYSAGDGVGSSVACGHLTGRSLADAVFGVPNASNRPLETAVPGSGGVLIWKVDGNQPTPIEQSDFNGNPRENGDHFGAAVAVGDVNGDFHDDLLVGVPGEDLANTTDNGAVSIYYGDGAGSFMANSLTLTEDTNNVPGNRQNGDHFGSSIALADLDFDLSAAMDMVIGLSGKTISGQAGAGAVDVLYNAGSGLPKSSGNQLLSQDSAGVLGAASAGDHFGARLAIGLYGKANELGVAIGVPGETVSGHKGAGAVAVFYDGGSGVSTTGNQLWTRDSSGIAGSSRAVDHFGHGL
jgi:hypothetical protein